jgi:hypothetical protein
MTMIMYNKAVLDSHMIFSVYATEGCPLAVMEADFGRFQRNSP